MNLTGKVAIVTGGSAGLGRQICHTLSASGTNVAVVYNRNHDDAQTEAGELNQSGVQSEAVRCDITDHNQVKTLVAEVMETFGRLDILINNAAYNKWVAFSDLDSLTSEVWNKIITTNLTAPMLLIKEVAEHMNREGLGRIVNIASIAGLSPRGSSIAYAVSKAGLIHLTKCMAVALAPKILVNCIAPGYMQDTRMSSNLSPEYQKRAIDGSVLKRTTDKDDVAKQVVIFCETESTTGQTISIDAGRHFH